MHDNSQVIAFLSVDVLPRCSIHPLVTDCPGDPCILCCCHYPGFILSRRGPGTQWPQSADPGQPWHQSQRSPRAAVRRHGDIWHLIAGSKNRDTGPGARRVKGSVMLEDILPCVVTSDCPVPVWSSAVFRDTRQLSSDRVSLGQAPSQQHGPARAQHWAQSGEHEFSWDRDEMSECNYRGQGPWQLPSLTSGARGASVTLWQWPLWCPVYSESDVTGPPWLPLTASRHLRWPVNLLIRKFVCVCDSRLELSLETWVCHVETRFVFQSF